MFYKDGSMRVKGYKVLCLPSWYPTRDNPVSGIFVKKHAEAVARFCDVAVLYVKTHSERKRPRYHLQSEVEDDIITMRVRCRTSSFPILKRFVNLIRYFRGVRIGLKALRKDWGNPQLVHVQVAWPAGLAALLLNLISRIPYIITEHWTGYIEYSDLFSKSSVILKSLTRVIFKKAAGCTAVSQYLLNSLKQNDFLRHQGFNVPNVVCLPGESFNFRKKPRRIRILTISLLNDKQKNVSGLIEAFGEVVKKYPDARLDIIGDGADREPVTDLAANLGLLDKNVFFQGYVPNCELYKWFARANFFVLNSNYETFSVATAEAIAHGVPVVVTKCGAPEEFVNKTVGILVERNDKQSLVEGIEYMIKNWRKYDPTKLYAYAKARFSTEIVGRQFYEIYKNILARVGTDV